MDALAGGALSKVIECCQDYGETSAGIEFVGNGEARVHKRNRGPVAPIYEYLGDAVIRRSAEAGSGHAQRSDAGGGAYVQRACGLCQSRLRPEQAKQGDGDEHAAAHGLLAGMGSKGVRQQEHVRSGR